MTVMPAAEGQPQKARPPGLAEFVRFVATGSLAAISNMIGVWAFEFVTPYPVAVVLGYIVGMVVAFILFQKVIFDHPGTTLSRRVFRFTVVNLIGMGLAWLTSMAMAYWVLPGIGWTFQVKRVANFFGVAVPAFSSYFLHKYYTYR